MYDDELFNENEWDEVEEALDDIDLDEVEFDEALYQKNLKENKFNYIANTEGEGIGE